MQGHLEKVHAKSHAFTPSSAKRYFFLTPQPSATLLYFRSEADCRVGKVRGFVNIGAECRVETDVSGSRSFVVHTPERQLRLIAESPSEAQRWVTAISAVARGSGPPAPPLQRQRPGRRGSWRQMAREAAAEEVVRRAATARTAELPPPPPSPRPRHPVRAALRLLERIRRAGFRSLAGLIAALRAALCIHTPRAEPLAGTHSALRPAAEDASSVPAQPGAPTCVVCLDAAPTHALVPCGHRCLCAGCARQLDACPLCRKPCTSAIRIFE